MQQFIYNTYNKKKQEFIPIESSPNNHKPIVKIYVCGQTVYDYCHIGHARKAIVFDMVRRWFITCGYEVILVENITDIDDKIINKANEEQKSIYDLTSHFITAMQKDFTNLNIMPPNYAPKATDYILPIMLMIQNLINQEHAYIANNGDVFFNIKNFKNYGQLSGKNLEELQAGERVSVNINKNNPLDFVLWKASTNQPSWLPQSYSNHNFSFGSGRPGWHIECSAMANEILGKTFDIHAGGQDLIFPHHENEIAQSESLHQCRFANYWMHNGFITVKSDKMSKSLGNFILIKELLQEFHPEVIRYFMLKTHYRSPLNYSLDHIKASKAIVDKIYHVLQQQNINIPKQPLNLLAVNNLLINSNHQELLIKFLQAMYDDFNTALGLSYLQQALNILATKNNINNDDHIINLFFFMANSLGLLLTPIDAYLTFGLKINKDNIEKLINQRKQAKLKQQYQQADDIRTELLNQGISLKDNNDGSTTWYVTISTN